MTPEQLAAVRARVGPGPTDAEIVEVFTRLGDSVAGTVVELLARQLSGLLAQPGVLTVPGEVGINNTANIDALQKQLAEARDEYATEVDGGPSLARVVPAPARPRR